MKTGTWLSAATVLSALALLLCAQCRRTEAPRADATLPATGNAPVGAEPPQAPAPPPQPTAVPAEAAAAGPPPSKGDWLDGNIYRFRLDDARPCPATAAGARVGAVVRVESKINELLVAPRDFKLESGGVILDSAIAPKGTAGCAPLLAPKSLRAGKTADGVVIFDLPPGFNPEHRPVRITYQPTRWGGAKRVEAVLPAAALPR